LRASAGHSHSIVNEPFFQWLTCWHRQQYHEKYNVKKSPAYKKNKRPFHPDQQPLTAVESPRNGVMHPNPAGMEPGTLKTRPFLSTTGGISAIRHDESLPLRCERSI